MIEIIHSRRVQMNKYNVDSRIHLYSDYFFAKCLIGSKLRVHMEQL